MKVKGEYVVKWFKVLPVVLALGVLTALIAVLVLRSTAFDDEGEIAGTPPSEPAQVIAQQPEPRIQGEIAETPVSESAQVVAPRPEPIIPGGAPFFFADRVSLAEARERTPYTIPIPAVVDEAGLTEVWVSSEEVTRPRRSVALHFTDGLRINLDGPVPYPNYAEMTEDPPFKFIRVNGNPGMGANPGVSEGLTGKEPYPGSVDWWVNEVQITIYHPTLSIDELLPIAESMPEPAWKPGAR